MANVSRVPVDHPALGTAGGAGLHTSIETIFTKLGDHLASRYFTATIGIGANADFAHNFKTAALADLQIHLFKDVAGELTEIVSGGSPDLDDFTITQTTGSLTTSINIDNGTGASQDIAVVIIHAPARFNGIYTNTISERTAGSGITADGLLVKDSALDFTANTKGTFKGLEAIVYRLNTSKTGAASYDPLGSPGGEWSIANTTENENKLGGTPVTEANGIFTLGNGYWNIEAFVNAQNNSSTSTTEIQIHGKTDVGSYAILALARQSITSAGALSLVSGAAGALVKIVNSNYKIKVVLATSQTTTNFFGNTARNETYIRFTKLADL